MQIEAQLKTVSIAGGYLVTLAAVYRGDHDPLSLPGFPAALILPVSDLPESGAWETNRRTLSVCRAHLGPGRDGPPCAAGADEDGGAIRHDAQPAVGRAGGYDGRGRQYLSGN